MDRRCCTTYLEVLIRPEILPGGKMDDPATWSQPTLELAPGFKAPLPVSYDSLKVRTVLCTAPRVPPLVYCLLTCCPCTA